MDTYKTISSPAPEVLIKEKKSKFYGYAFPITTEEEVKPIIAKLKKKHHGAVHFCYAYQLGEENSSFRVNDDGEPGNSAGAPIYGQIQSFNLTNVLVVVVRFYGGVKLGIGGLMAAYKLAAHSTLDGGEIIERTIDVHFILTFDYKHLNKIMHIIKEKNLKIITQNLAMECEIEVASRKKNQQLILNTFNELYEVKTKLKT